MQIRIASVFSVIFQIFSACLAVCGLISLSRFEWYSGEYYDSRLIVFDNGVYPFLWGMVFLVFGLLMRLFWRRGFLGCVAIIGLFEFSYELIVIPEHIPAGCAVFPSADLLKDLIVVCLVSLGLVLVEKHIRQGVNFLLSVKKITW